MIILQSNDLFIEGGQRICYTYPTDENKIIKIDKDGSKSNNIEFQYYSYLQKKCINLDFIAKCFGFIETNFGTGLVFEKIRDYDGNVSLSFREVLQLHKIEEKYEEKLLNDLRKYLLKNLILFSDCTTVNVMCKRINSTEYKLIIIDGLGPKNDGIKSILYYYLPFYKKYKIQKQWKIFLENIKKVKEKIRLNKKL